MTTPEGVLFKVTRDSSRNKPQKEIGSYFKQEVPQGQMTGAPTYSLPSKIEQAIKYATSERKLEHFFKNEMHGLQPLLKIMDNNKEKIIHEVIRLLSTNKNMPIQGEFKNIPVFVSGYTIHARGFVHDDIIKLGTIFIPQR